MRRLPIQRVLRHDCRYAHPHLSELKGLVEASKSGGQESEGKRATQLRKPSPLRTSLKRPLTPGKQPPAKKISFANLLTVEDQFEKYEGDAVERESEIYEGGDEEDNYE